MLVELKDIQDMKKEKSKRNMFSDSLLIVTKDKQEVTYLEGFGAYVYPDKVGIDFSMSLGVALMSNSIISRTCLGEMRYVNLVANPEHDNIIDQLSF